MRKHTNDALFFLGGVALFGILMDESPEFRKFIDFGFKEVRERLAIEQNLSPASVPAADDITSDKNTSVIASTASKRKSVGNKRSEGSGQP